MKADIWALQGKLNAVTNDVVAGQTVIKDAIIHGQGTLRNDIDSLKAEVTTLSSKIDMILSKLG